MSHDDDAELTDGLKLTEHAATGITELRVGRGFGPSVGWVGWD